MENYIKKIAELKKFGLRDEKEIYPDQEKEIVISKNKTRKVRTLGDSTLSERSQRMYSEDGEQITKAPKDKYVDKGTVGNSDMQGSWGKVND